MSFKSIFLMVLFVVAAAVVGSAIFYFVAINCWIPRLADIPGWCALTW